MKINLLKTLFVMMVAVLLGCTAAQAQTVTATITGTITDTSDAAIVGAQVVAHNEDTGVDSPAKTNASGIYRIEFLPIGTYTVSVEAKGFEKAMVPAFQLEVLQTATFNLKLGVSGSSTTVAISAAVGGLILSVLAMFVGGQRRGSCATPGVTPAVWPRGLHE